MTKLREYWKSNPARIFVGLLVLAVAGLLLWLYPWPKPKIDSFEACSRAGYPIQESYPAVCRTPDGKSFTEPVTAPTLSGGAPTIVPLTILVSNGSVLTANRQSVVRTKPEWELVWQQVHAKTTPMPNIISVDFTKEMVALTVLDQKPSGGYYVSVARIEETEAKITVHLTETRPGKGCVVTQAVSGPYTIVKFAKSDKQVEFVTTQQTKDCAAQN